MAWWTRNNQ